jgi:transcriptional regulator with XRE-family HTH domain
MSSGNPIFGRNLKKHRKERGLTQTDLGDKIGVSKGCISNWERGYRDPSYSEIFVVADALGIDPKKLIERRAEEREVKKEDKK